MSPLQNHRWRSEHAIGEPQIRDLTVKLVLRLFTYRNSLCGDNRICGIRNKSYCMTPSKSHFYGATVCHSCESPQLFVFLSEGYIYVGCFFYMKVSSNTSLVPSRLEHTSHLFTQALLRFQVIVISHTHPSLNPLISVPIRLIYPHTNSLNILYIVSFTLTIINNRPNHIFRFRN